MHTETKKLTQKACPI